MTMGLEDSLWRTYLFGTKDDFENYTRGDKYRGRHLDNCLILQVGVGLAAGAFLPSYLDLIVAGAILADAVPRVLPGFYRIHQHNLRMFRGKGVGDDPAGESHSPYDGIFQNPGIIGRLREFYGKLMT
jgi:hypothetical protein